MIQDKDTNIVYISEWLVKEYPDFYSRFTEMMFEMGIKWDLLKYTEDIWARDYMPVQLDENDYLKYNYSPDYLLKLPEKQRYMTDCARTIKELGISVRTTDIKIDGGNVVACGDYIVMTEKVFQENGKSIGDPFFIKELVEIFKHDIIFIPWKPHYDDEYGHSDGFVKWCGGNTILMSNHSETDSEEAKQIKIRLESKGFAITDMTFEGRGFKTTPDCNWAYINFLQVGNKIIVPSFGIPEDRVAYEYIRSAFPNCDIRQIRMKDVVKKSGALHCLTWNIKR